jgi:hypothetical protein
MIKRSSLLISFAFTVVVLLSGCQALGEHFKYMGECDREVASTYPPNWQEKMTRIDTSCGKLQFSNSTSCTSNPVYERYDANYQPRLQARNECIARKKANGGR